ncbi:hypothetical protein [Oceanobacter mangrovi]|uniref:hypothetical protein n=1 Tax=Oceanobacter mangrovi TaxID=2862510 RepID=UPI001C8D8DAA|nr:hypothetical protein [Oceanobacter mangrovi]
MNVANWLSVVLTGVVSCGAVAGTVASTSLQNPVSDSLTADRLESPTPYLLPQCYTQPKDEAGVIHNPCYACHTESKQPNYFSDVDVQVAYNMPEPGVTHSWSNVYKDRTAEIAKISDQEILQYVRQDNYSNQNGTIYLAEKLKQVPAEWDRNKNGQWDGYVPDVYFQFDEQGFDRDPAGNPTGWRVFAYYPFLGTFMPTNGSTDDVLIRLPEAFRQLNAGEYDQQTYMVNLAIVESLMKQRDVVITEVDENRFGVDLNKDGKLAKSSLIRYDWAPLKDIYMSYVGQAKQLLDEKQVHLAARLYPEGTEFVHSVRYIDIDSQGNSAIAPRMKELRYGRKASWRTYFNLQRYVEKEEKERHDFPERTKELIGNMEDGLVLKTGWIYQGFIEDKAGELRPQSYEENYFCVGCHSGIGVTNDSTFAFTRKFDAANSYKEGWYHWMEKGFAGVADPLREDGQGEYAYYLQQNPTGNEFRTNDEVRQRFFNADGSKKTAAFEQLKTDINNLMMPSRERALQLNKAYKVIVDEQSYKHGRDAVIKPMTSVQKEVELYGPTGITEILSYY